MTTQNTAIIDKLLTNVSRKHVPEGYISEMVLPVAQVKQTTGKIGFYGKEHLRVETSVVGGATAYPRINTTVRSSDTYSVTKHGLSATITEEDFDNVEQPFEIQSDTTLDLTTKLWLEKEKSLADTLGDVSVVTQNVTLSGTSQYNDFGNSTPITDFRNALVTTRDASGMRPNLAVMDWSVSDTLKYHPELIDLVKHTSTVSDGLNDQQLAFVLGVRKIFLGDVHFNDSKTGQADILKPVWGKNITFLVAPPTPSKQQVTFGYRVQRKNPRRAFREKLINPPGSELLMVDDSYQFLIVDTTAAFLIKDAIA